MRTAGPKSIAPKKPRAFSALGTAAAGGLESLLQPDARKNPCGIVIIQWYGISNSWQQKIVLIPAPHVRYI